MMIAGPTSACYTGHAFQRAQQRYGVTLLPQDMEDILAACLSGDAPQVRQDSTVTVHVAIHKGMRFVVVVQFRKLILTFLPPGATALPANRKIRDYGRETTRREPYKRSKVRLCDLRRGDFEDRHP